MSFTPSVALVSPYVISDPEFLEARLCFVTPNGETWTGRVDPQTGLGAGHIKDRLLAADGSTASTMARFNGPEWFLHNGVWRVVYTRTFDGATGWEVWSSLPDGTDARHIAGPEAAGAIGTKAPTGPARILCVRGLPGSQEGVYCSLEDPAMRPIPGYVAGTYDAARPVVGESDRITYGAGNAIRLLDFNVGEPVDLIHDCGGPVVNAWYKPAVVGDPGYILAIIGRSKVSIWRDGLRVDIVPPADCPYGYLGSVEPFPTLPYVSFQAGATAALDAPAAIIVASMDGTLVRRVDDGAVTGHALARTEPEPVELPGGTAVYFGVTGKLYRAWTGL